MAGDPELTNGRDLERRADGFAGSAGSTVIGLDGSGVTASVANPPTVAILNRRANGCSASRQDGDRTGR